MADCIDLDQLERDSFDYAFGNRNRERLLNKYALFSVASTSFGISTKLAKSVAKMLKVAALHEMSVNVGSVLTLALSLAT